MALDRFGRKIQYLRISLTDYCNLRCIYCMPEDMTFRPKEELMQDEEVLLLVRLFAGLGFRKFRLTGGEPTVRPRLPELIGALTQIEGVESLSMTTNGVLLPRLAAPLKDAGLQRVNVSLDTLDAAKFNRLTRRDKFAAVWEGILEAERVGLTPIKLNAVVVRGYNDMDVVDLARLTLERDWQVRFIEMMPFGGIADFQVAQVVGQVEMMARIEEALGNLTPLHEGKLDGEARIYRLSGAKGEVGFISSVTAAFCAACTRARLTADGKLRLCLLRDQEVDLLTPLRAGATLDDLRLMILDGVYHKPWGHGLAENDYATDRVMSEIGG